MGVMRLYSAIWSLALKIMVGNVVKSGWRTCQWLGGESYEGDCLGVGARRRQKKESQEGATRSQV